MTTSKYAAVVVAVAAIATLGLATLLISSDGRAASRVGKAGAPQSPQACACAPSTSVTLIGTTLVHCQCGAATCVVAEHITGVAKSYSFQCTK
jgi:hypothetical protein